MKIKQCFKCNIRKTIEHFYKHKGMSDGYINKCKECVIKYNATDAKTEKIVCVVCKKDFKITKSEKKRERQYCSWKCWVKNQRITIKHGEEHHCWLGGKLNCEICNKPLANYGTKRCCKHKITTETREKFRKNNLGEKNYFFGKHLKGAKAGNWKGGITPENKKIRDSIETNLWREAVFARDNWTCQRCKTKNGEGKTVYLNSHHIQNFAQFSELRTSIENGITFCKNCHNEFHKKYGFKNNTREQLKEFLKCLEK